MSVLPAFLLALLAQGPLVRPMAGAEVDWSAGTITARGGAAADIRLPSPDIARPGAERRARAAAAAKLRAALGELPLGGGRKLSNQAIEAALAKARPVSVEHQSNGGVWLALVLGFADLVEARGPEVALAVAAAPLELAPVVAAGDREAPLGRAVYRHGEPPAGTKVLEVKRDRQGRLLIGKGEAPAVEKLAGAPAVIYVEKVLR